MNIVERVKNICLQPNAEWPVIAEETTPTGGLITGYVVPLAAIGAVAGFIGGSLIGYSLPFVGTYRVPIINASAGAILTIVLSVVGVFVLSLIINALAPTFGAQKNSAQALKVAVYSYTPAWVAGVFQILPTLGILAVLGGLYGLYLLYLGLPRLMKCPQDKAVSYTAVVVVCAVVVMIVTAAIGGMVAGAGMAGSGAFGSLTGGAGNPSGVEFDSDSPLGRLAQLGEKLDESNQKIEAAEKSGDESAQVAAALEGLGTLLGGGRRVEPVEIEQLKSFVPETFAGLPRTRNSAEKTGLAGVMVSTAEASYGDGADKEVTMEVVDTGGASGLIGLASWMGVQGEREDDEGSERTQKVGNRLVHEKISKTGGENEFAIVLGERFMVTARGRGVSLNELKSAVSSIDLGRLESMKDEGVQ